MSERRGSSAGRLTPYAQVAIAAMGWGTWSLFLRPSGVHAWWSSSIVLATLTVACAPLLARKSAHGPTDGRPRQARDWWTIVLLAFVDAANVGLFFAAMNTTSIAVAVLSHYLAPVLVSLLAPIVLGTLRRRGAALEAMAAMFGLALVLEPWKLGNAQGSPVLGALLGGGSAVFYAANVLIAKRLAGRFTAEEQLVYHSAGSALILALLAVALGAPLPTTMGVVRVVVGGCVIGATAGLVFLRGLLRMPAEHAGLLTFLEPLTAVAVAWVAWGEKPGPLAAVGALVVIGAGAVAVMSPSPTPEADAGV